MYFFNSTRNLRYLEFDSFIMKYFILSFYYFFKIILHYIFFLIIFFFAIVDNYDINCNLFLFIKFFYFGVNQKWVGEFLILHPGLDFLCCYFLK